MAPPEGGGAVVTLSEARFKQMQAAIRQATEENGALRVQLRDARQGSTSDRRGDGSDNPRGSGPRPLEVRGPRDPREHRTITQLQHELDEARATAQYYERTFSKVERKAAKWKELAETYYGQTRGLWDANQAQEAELNIIRSQLQDAQSLASIRGKELVGSQVFLTKADSLSVSDIVQKLDQLNDEIYQASAFLGESIAFKRSEIDDKQRDECFEVAMDVLGLPLVKVLSELSSHAKPTIHQLVVQIAWQVLLCKYCLNVVTSWYPNDGNAAKFLSDLYGKIRDKEDGAVAGRWRSLTRLHTKPSPDGWEEELYKLINAVLVTACWQAEDPKQKETFSQKLVHIFKAVLEVREALGEKFTSADLELVFVTGGDKFDSQTMVDSWDVADDDGEEGLTVAGTTGLGLSLKKKGENTIHIISQTKVVLESTLKAAIA